MALSRAACMAGLLVVISILLAASTPATAAPRNENAPNTSNGNVNPASGPSEAAGNGNHKFGFQDCGGAKACLGILHMERIRKRSGQSHKTVDQLADDLDKDKDLGVDLANSMLIYECSGLDVSADPGLQAVAAAALAAEPTDPSADILITAGTILPNDLPTATTAGAATITAAPSVDPTDPLLGLDAYGQTGHRHHRHLMQTRSNAEIASGWLPSSPDTPLTVAQTFKLHSRPNATRKILLDFDGHVTTGTAWNSAKGKDPIITPPYDKDGSPSTWSAAELSDILAIWRAIAEDYACFDVDVTTEDPGAAYLASNGVRAVIGGSAMDWYGTAVGGVAYVGVFGRYNNFYQPAFIFPKQLGPDYAKYIWDAASHEIGHNLGLSHDGTATASYYTGQGDWAPIMGVGYSKAVTQFSKGEYNSANNLEDDFQVMSAYLGAPTAILQEHGSTAATATPLVGKTDTGGATATAVATGIIRQPTDVEVFSFTAGAAGLATLSVSGASKMGSVVRSNLNVNLILTGPTGTRITSQAGVGILPFSVSLPSAGTYTVSLSPVGVGDPKSDGYSAYGSRGQYELTVTYPLAKPNPVQTMFIKSFTMDKSVGTRTTCIVYLTMVTPVQGVNQTLPDVTITGTYTSKLPATGFPYSLLGTTLASNGMTTFPSRSLPNDPGNGCTFTINSVSKPGYVLSGPGPNLALSAAW